MIRKAVLSVKDVAKLEGVTTVQVAYWCRNDQIFPCERVGKNWVIHTNYIRTNYRGRHRPNGSKNKPKEKHQ